MVIMNFHGKFHSGFSLSAADLGKLFGLGAEFGAECFPVINPC